MVYEYKEGANITDESFHTRATGLLELAQGITYPEGIFAVDNEILAERFRIEAYDNQQRERQCLWFLRLVVRYVQVTLRYFFNRDFNPGTNMIMDRDERLLLLDFDLCSMESGVSLFKLLGSDAYTEFFSEIKESDLLKGGYDSGEYYISWAVISHRQDIISGIIENLIIYPFFATVFSGREHYNLSRQSIEVRVNRIKSSKLKGVVLACLIYFLIKTVKKTETTIKWDIDQLAKVINADYSQEDVKMLLGTVYTLV